MQLGRGRPTDQIDREKLILKSSVELFSNQGIDNVGVRAIAEHSGVSFGLIRHYFGPKKDLIEACNRYAMKQLKEFFRLIIQFSVGSDAKDFTREATIDEIVRLISPRIVYIRYFVQILMTNRDPDNELFKEYYAAVSSYIDEIDALKSLSGEYAKEWIIFEFIFLQFGPAILMGQISDIIGSDAFLKENMKERIGSMARLLDRGIFENSHLKKM